MDKEQKKRVNLHPKAAGQHRSSSAGGITPRLIGQNLCDHLFKIEAMAAKKVSEQVVTQVTERWIEQQVKLAA